MAQKIPGVWGQRPRVACGNAGGQVSPRPVWAKIKPAAFLACRACLATGSRFWVIHSAVVGAVIRNLPCATRNRRRKDEAGGAMCWPRGTLRKEHGDMPESTGRFGLRRACQNSGSGHRFAVEVLPRLMHLAAQLRDPAR